ncbi:hypothetical protein DVH24_021515 [Malus domestica]|uniref:F-box domain-containing protein n=1 Tax=Malus domestica TaxID=3750 RepID=A0A498K0A4_MALDO|nr:hypothetical protein DVH24_021515 [Malus domestica]
MQSIFDDVLLKILVITVVKMVSKNFKEIVEDPRIYQHINITDLETVNLLGSWGASNKVSTFINHYECNLRGPSSCNVHVWCDIGVPRVRFEPRMAQTSLFSQPSQLVMVECDEMPRHVSTVFAGFLGA